jgi:hypothetical protein
MERKLVEIDGKRPLELNISPRTSSGDGLDEH